MGGVLPINPPFCYSVEHWPFEAGLIGENGVEGVQQAPRALAARVCPAKHFTSNGRACKPRGSLLKALFERVRVQGKMWREIKRLSQAFASRGAMGDKEAQVSGAEAEQLARQLRVLTLATERLAQKLRNRWKG